MFIDQEWRKKPPEETNKESFEQQKTTKFNALYWIIVLFVTVLATGVIFIVYLNSDYYIESRNPVVRKNSNDGASTTASLPSYFSDDNPEAVSVLIPDDLKAEDLYFGSFYEEPKEKTLSTIEKFSLPINIKSDVVNYYDVSRKINFDNQIDALNNNAFAFLDEAENIETSDFFSTYRDLFDKEIPVFVSSDFVRYYQQNVLKTVYKEIEKNVFYENLWDITKKLYDISLARFQNHLENISIENDTMLEAKRLETAFLAVALELLRPKDDQINKEEAFLEDSLFTPKEAQVYYFNMPRDLRNQVEKEASLIYAAEEVTKSPVFLYDKDYTGFTLKEQYLSDAKLKNYYLARKWLNAFFPLFYRGETCPDCLLDYEDWLNNFAAVNLLANDFEENQELKNRWALIYKFIAFFEGLRSDLTYLHLNQARLALYPESDAFAELFSKNEKQSSNLKAIQEELQDISFLPIEGGIKKNVETEKSAFGVRFLQDLFLADDYVFSELSGVDLSLLNMEERSQIMTTCKIGADYYRCNGFSGDILKLHNLPLKSVDQRNFQYASYDNKLSNIKTQINQFDSGTWNSNVYWINFDLSNRLVQNSSNFIENLSLNEEWVSQRVVNNVLGSWINVILDLDEWETYEPERNQNLGFLPSCSTYTYIEPQIELISDMIERNKMLLKAIEVLRVGKRTNAASLALFDLNKRLGKFLDISRKELNGEYINEEECFELKEMITDISVTKLGDKKYVIYGEEGEKITNSLKDLKLMFFVRQNKEGKKSLVVGPVFSLKEYK